jgi:formamidopyrimidine-DNA glycosylase
MPELPEVETVKNGIKSKLENLRLRAIDINIEKLRVPVPKKELLNLINFKITKIHRRAKYLILDLDCNDSIIFHLGMSGKLILTRNNYQIKKHDHLVFYFEDHYILVFHDPRRFGLVEVELTDSLANSRLLSNLGPEPFDRNFNASYLMNKFKNKKIPIKLAIMDNNVVVGIGNIYAAESLFLAKIHPLQPSNSISLNLLRKLINSCQIILQKAIISGGSTLKDYVDSDGKAGYFQHDFKVYGKENKNCFTCSTSIMNIKLGGRSTYYCPSCQKLQ